MTKRRCLNLDLVRIVSMLLIILLHSIDHSGVLESARDGSGLVSIYVYFAYAASQVCVNLYVMISGYFLVLSEFRLSKLINIWMETVFYSFTLKFISLMVFNEHVSAISLLGCFFPIITGRYWFVTIYFGLYVIFPFLNMLIKSLNMFWHTALNVLLLVLFSIIISIHPQIAGMNSGGGWGLAWFRLYYTPHHNRLLLFCVWLFVSAFISISYYAASKANVTFFQLIIGNWYRYDSVPVYIMTLAVFVFFLNVEIKNKVLSKVIEFVTPHVFGVYLIHAHANVSPSLWGLLQLPSKMNDWFFFLIQLSVVVSIFAICIILDYIRTITIGRLEKAKSVRFISDKFMIVLNKAFCRLMKKCLTNLERKSDE